jgi:hypothetical protein
VNQNVFDFIFVLDEKRKIHCVGMFNLKRSDTVLECHYEVRILEFEDRLGGFIVTTTDGFGHLISFRPITVIDGEQTEFRKMN